MTATHAAHELRRTAVLDVMTKDAAAIRTYERPGRQCIGTITHHHGDSQTEPALAYVCPTN